MQTQTAVGKRKNATRVTSAAVAAAADKRSIKSVIVSGISAGKLITVSKSMFGRLDVDPSYQRGKVNMVAQIVRAIQQGGSILDPVTLCQRKGSDKLWIVDGFQRTTAFCNLGVPFQAMLHESDTPEDEHNFFIALNSRTAVGPNVIVKAWTGPVGALLHKANDSFEHPLNNKINFQQGKNSSRVGASVLARAMLNVIHVSGQSPNAGKAGRVDKVLSRLDVAVSGSVKRARMEHFLRIVGNVCAKEPLPPLVLQAIATVAKERWSRDVKMPSIKVIERLSKKNWRMDAILTAKYMPVIIQSVEKIWKEEA